ncbi:MAG TPA: class I SAM-dependent methyltransferase, partial [Bacteroidia bacterium]|nr:class I SAM-dependent methyltransferase [Bacteroidia bacterium]
MRLSENICLALNKCFPKKKTQGRGSPSDYSMAQYNWGKQSLEVFGPYVNLKDKVVLDAGCSFGGKTFFWAEQGCASIIGLDLDEKRINHAKEYAASKNRTDVKYVQGNLLKLPFETDTFDIIFLDDVVEHIDRNILTEALKECKRVLKPGGRLCIEFPPWTSFDAGHLYDYIYIPWCQIIFSQKTLINVLNKLAPNAQTLGTLSYVDHFKDLNRLTINEFKDIIRKIDFKAITMRPIILLRMNFLQ